MEPTFDVPIVNVTVVRGQIALLPCSIDFLGKYKVPRSLLLVLRQYTRTVLFLQCFPHYLRDFKG